MNLKKKLEKSITCKKIKCAKFPPSAELQLFGVFLSKKESKDQKSIQTSTTSVP